MSRLLPSLRRFASATNKHDAVIIGGGPVGTEIARLCGLVGRRVAVVDPRGALLAAPTGYVSKVLLQCSNDFEGGVCEGDPWAHAEASLAATAGRALAMTHELFQDANVGADVLAGRTDFAPDVVPGRATFAARGADGAYEVEVRPADAPWDGAAPEVLRAETVFVATGSRSTRLDALPWEDPAAVGWIFDSDSIVGAGRVPDHLFIQGGGLIAVEYAFIFRRLGARVTVALRESTVLEGKDVDVAVSAAVAARLEARGVDLRFNDGDVVRATPPAAAGGPGEVELGSGATVSCDMYLSALGRGGGAGELGVERAGLASPLPSGHLGVDSETLLAARKGDVVYTTTSRVYAAGDAAGPNAIAPGGLLSTGLAQAHVAVRAAFAADWRRTFPRVGRRVEGAAFDALPAIAFWIDDGVATCGLTTQAATAAHGADAATATAKYAETVKACVQPRPDDEFLKLVYLRSTGEILGVHVFGKDASEMINHGASFVNRSATVWDVIHSIPPAVTYDEVFLRAARKACYSLAAFQGGRAAASHD